MGKVSSEPIAFDASFQGPVGKRSCRDVFWLLLFVLFLVGWGVLGWQALITGNPKEIL